MPLFRKTMIKQIGPYIPPPLEDKYGLHASFRTSSFLYRRFRHDDMFSFGVIINKECQVMKLMVPRSHMIKFDQVPQGGVEDDDKFVL